MVIYTPRIVNQVYNVPRFSGIPRDIKRGGFNSETDLSIWHRI